MSRQSIETMDKTAIARLVGDEYVVDVIREFERTLNTIIAEWQPAHENQNWLTIQLLCHKLKSSAAFVGLHQLAANLAQLEHNIKLESQNLPITEQSLSSLKLLKAYSANLQ